MYQLLHKIQAKNGWLTDKLSIFTDFWSPYTWNMPWEYNNRNVVQKYTPLVPVLFQRTIFDKQCSTGLRRNGQQGIRKHQQKQHGLLDAVTVVSENRTDGVCSSHRGSALRTTLCMHLHFGTHPMVKFCSKFCKIGSTEIFDCLFYILGSNWQTFNKIPMYLLLHTAACIVVFLRAYGNIWYLLQYCLFKTIYWRKIIHTHVFCLFK